MVCWQMVRFLIQLRPSMYFDVSLISLQIQSIQCMLHEARCWKYMSSIICLQSQLFEEACFVNLFGWWFCTPICKSTWTYSDDVNFFFLEGENDVFSVWWFCLWQDVTRFWCKWWCYYWGMMYGDQHILISSEIETISSV